MKSLFNSEFRERLIELLIDFSHLPMIEAAAEILDMDIASVEGFLSKKGVKIYQSKYLSEEAISALSEKYIGKIHKFYNRLSNNISCLPHNEQAYFLQFLAKYAKKDRIHVKSWEDIDQSLLIADFKKELFSSVNDSEETSFVEKFLSNRKVKNTLSHKLKYLLLFASKEKQAHHNIFPVTRNITSIFIESNRYHIFTSDSDETGSNLYFRNNKLNQPQCNYCLV